MPTTSRAGAAGAGRSRVLSRDGDGSVPCMTGDRLDREILEPFLRGMPMGRLAQFSPLAFGVTPFVYAFILVELIALAAGWSWDWAVFFQDLRGMHGHLVMDLGLGPMIGVAAALTLGSLALGCVAVLLSRFGLGNGFALLLALAAVEDGFDLVKTALRTLSAFWTDASLIVVLAAAVFPLVLASRPRRSTEGPSVPVPTCGLAIIVAPAAIIAFPYKVATWFPSLQQGRRGALARNGAQVR